MQLSEIQDLIAKIKGCTFASLDSVTYPSKGIRRECVKESVILFASPGYEDMVNRRLASIGKTADFAVSSLPWGERLDNSPIIYHVKDGVPRHYLQTILLKEGECHFYICDTEVDPAQLGLPRSGVNQGLPRENEVVVRTYRLDNITAIRLMGEERPILSAKF